MRIDEPVKERKYMDGQGSDAEERTSYSVRATYQLHNGKEVQLQVQIGKTCVETLTKKFPNDSYVGKLAFFKQTKFKGNYPQFITPFEGTQRQNVNLDELFADAPTELKPITSFAAPTFEQLIEREDLKKVITECVAQGDKFAQAFSQTVMVEGVGFHDEFKKWIDANTTAGHIGVRLSTSECEKLYGHILGLVTKR
jgi:hypothetical protein